MVISFGDCFPVGNGKDIVCARIYGNSVSGILYIFPFSFDLSDVLQFLLVFQTLVVESNR